MKTNFDKSIMIVAGEASGDMHAAGVIRALLSKNKKLKIFGLGGPLMARAGMEVREDLTKNAIMGVVEVVRHLPLSLRRLWDCEKWLREEKPDLLVLVDYPGFNLRLAEKARLLGVPVCYYIAPQAWAWHEGRIRAMRENIRKLLVILPFEEKFFRERGMEAVHVGHPLLEEMDLKPPNRLQVLKKYGLDPARFPLITAMPGSRKKEVEKIWPLFLAASRLLIKGYPDAAFIVPKPHGLEFADYPGLKSEDPFVFVDAPAWDLRKICELAWVKSGTGTLETALLQIPLVVVAKVAALTGFLARRLIKLKYISLPNLLTDSLLVPELLQEMAVPEKLYAESLALLEKKPIREKQIKGFAKLKNQLAQPSKPSHNAAREILKLLGRKA